MPEANEHRSFFAQLRQRRVVRAAIAYGAAAFVVWQAAEILFPALGLTERALRLLVIASLAGFPVVLVMAWVFELTPEGIRLTSSEGRLVARVRPWVMFTAGGVLALAVLGASILWLRPGLLAGEVAPGADVIAVVPFNTSGPGVEAMGEGMMDLLSRNLDQVGVIRTVDPRTVLHDWKTRSEDGDLSRTEMLAVGREVKAGSVLTGSVVSAGGRVRITADLLGVDGSRLASATVDGEEHQVLQLVDSVSVLLLREIWRSREPMPTVDISAVSTSNLTAIRSFLAGEKYYRASDWDGAEDAFRQAIEADSTFALAYYRLSWVAGWTGVDAASRQEYIEMALRYAGRLPERTRRLLGAQELEVRGERAEALDTLRVLAERYPDDPDVWQALADGEYHLSYEGMRGLGQPLADQLRGFDHVLDLDPGFVPAMIHPLEVSYLYADSARIQRYVGLLKNVPSVTPATLEILDDGRAALGNPDDVVGLISALSVAMQTTSRTGIDLRWQMARATFPALQRAAATRPAEESEVVAEWLRGEVSQRDPAYQTTASETWLDLLIASGRLGRARALLDSGPAVRVSPKGARAYAVLPVLAGYLAPDDPVAAAALADVDATTRSAARLVGAVDGRDRSAVEALAAAADSAARSAPDTTYERTRLRGLAAVARGFGRALDGEAAGLTVVERELRGPEMWPGWISQALWLRWLELAASNEGTRTRALAVLQTPWPGNPAFETRRLYLLGQVLEARDDSAGAADAYRRFVGILANADPGLRIQGDIDRARAALGSP